jgi:preprotein translocase subunit SecG
MLTFFTVLHILVAVFMIFVILLQPGKEDGMGAALGGGGGAATTAFGGRGAVTFLSKLTAGCAVVFFMTSLGLSFVGSKKSVMAGSEAAPVTNPLPAGATAPSTNAAPATPGPASAQPGATTAPAQTAPATDAAKTPAADSAQEPSTQAAPAQSAPTK